MIAAISSTLNFMDAPSLLGDISRGPALDLFRGAPLEGGAEISQARGHTGIDFGAGDHNHHAAEDRRIDLLDQDRLQAGEAGEGFAQPLAQRSGQGHGGADGHGHLAPPVAELQPVGSGERPHETETALAVHHLHGVDQEVAGAAAEDRLERPGALLRVDERAGEELADLGVALQVFRQRGQLFPQLVDLPLLFGEVEEDPGIDAAEDEAAVIDGVRHDPDLRSRDPLRPGFQSLDRIGDQALLVLDGELLADEPRGHLDGEAGGQRIDLLGRRIVGDLDLAARPLDHAVRLLARILLDPALDVDGVAASLVDDGGRLAAGRRQPLLVLLEARLGRVAVPLRLLQRLEDERLARLEVLEDRAPGILAEDEQHADEDDDGPDGVADVAGEGVVGAALGVPPFGGHGRRRHQHQGDQSSQKSGDPLGDHRRNLAAQRTASRQMMTANSVTPSISAEVMIIAVLICPFASGWRAIASTALAPMRPMPAAPPMITRPEPMAPPSLRAPSVVKKPPPPAPSWAWAGTDVNIIAMPTKIIRSAILAVLLLISIYPFVVFGKISDAPPLRRGARRRGRHDGRPPTGR